MKVLKTHSYFILLTICSILGCSSEGDTFDKSLLYGHWEIKSAQRDGHPTETLTNTFFEFSEDGKMVTNFNLDGNEVSGKFEIEGYKITQQSEPKIHYSVEIIEKDKLVLLTKLMEYDFTINLKKKE